MSNRTFCCFNRAPAQTILVAPVDQKASNRQAQTLFEANVNQKVSNPQAQTLLTANVDQKASDPQVQRLFEANVDQKVSDAQAQTLLAANVDPNGHQKSPDPQAQTLLAVNVDQKVSDLLAQTLPAANVDHNGSDSQPQALLGANVDKKVSDSDHQVQDHKVGTGTIAQNTNPLTRDDHAQDDQAQDHHAQDHHAQNDHAQDDHAQEDHAQDHHAQDHQVHNYQICDQVPVVVDIDLAELNTPLKDLSKFYLHNLGDEERKRLDAFRHFLPTVFNSVRAKSQKAHTPFMFWGANMEVQGDPADIILLKHLRAENGQLKVAADRLVETLVYRAEKDLDNLAFTDSEALGGEFAGSGMSGGLDVKGRPVIISMTPSGKDADKMMEDVDGFTRYGFWMKEQAFKRINFASGAPEDICQIVDLSTAKFGPPPKAVKESAGVFKKHCPESNGVNIFVNVPAVVVGMFKLCRNFVDARTFERIRLHGKGDFHSLFELVHPESLPLELGGMLQDEGLKEVQCNFQEVAAGETHEFKVLDVTQARTVQWELRVCNLDSRYTVFFIKDGLKEVIQEGVVTAETGVLAGMFNTSDAGELKICFSSDFARFGAASRARMCICRAQ